MSIPIFPAMAETTVTPHTVEIIGGNGGIIRAQVMARNCKEALLCVLESQPDEHDCWSWPGWRSVMIFPTRKAFILPGGAE